MAMRDVEIWYGVQGLGMDVGLGLRYSGMCAQIVLGRAESRLQLRAIRLVGDIYNKDAADRRIVCGAVHGRSGAEYAIHSFVIHEVYNAPPLAFHEP